MSKERRSKDELERELRRTGEFIDTLRRGEVDLLLGEKGPLSIQFHTLVKERELLLETISKDAHEWHSTFDSMDSVVWIINKHQIIQKANKTTEKYFDISAEDVIGRQCWEIVHNTTHPIPECPFLRICESKNRQSMDIQIGDKWFEITVDPIFDDNSELTGAVHIVRDITDRKTVEEENRKQMARLKRFNSIMIGRELRMIELKNEINELCSKLNLEPRYSVPGKNNIET